MEGALGVLLIVKVTETPFGFQTTPPSLPTYIDNKEVISRGKTPPPKMYTNSHMALDYDVWETTTRLQKRMAVRLKCMWVKGH